MPIMNVLALLQEWRRRRRRIEKKRRKLAEADVVIVSHAKSGRTWLLTMLSHYYHLTRGTPADRLIDGSNFKLRVSEIPSVFYTSGWEFDPNADIGDLLGRKKVVFLYRDPRDVVVSRFHHMTHRMPAMERANR